jgi:hypothetical protein
MDYDFNPVNVFVICLAGVVAFIGLLTFVFNLQHDINARDTKVKATRYETCRTIEDPALRVMCVSGVK